MMTNAEIRIKLKEYENEYESLKIKLEEVVSRMKQLDEKYNEVNDVLYKRTKGRM